MLDFLKSPYENSILPQCPYHQLGEIWGGPNVKWCEERICSFINEPTNTWSNLAYIVVALYLYFAIKKDQRSEYSFLPHAIFWTGFFSFTYHASNLWLTQYFDFFGMYLMSSCLSGFNFIRLGWIKSKKSFITYNVIFNLLFSFLFFLSPKINFPVQLLVVIAVLMMVGGEVINYLKNKNKIDYQYKHLFITLTLFIIAISFSIMDHKRIICIPDHPIIQGHAIWHVICSFGFYFAYQFYRQIPKNHFKNLRN